MEYYTISKKQLEKMFEHYIERKKYKQESSGQDTIWSGGECSEAEKWLSLFGADLDYFRVQSMVAGEMDSSVFSNCTTFYGKSCNYAFTPVLEGEKMYHASLYAGKESPDMARFCSVDECILWALYKLEEYGKNSSFCFIIVGTDVHAYSDYNHLILDAWKTLTDVNVDENDGIEQDWFIFPAGTNREEIWHWFDARYEKGVVDLFYGHDSISETEPFSPKAFSSDTGMPDVDVEYYNLSGKKLHFKICPGDLHIVCNVLFDYCNMLTKLLENPPAEVDENTLVLWKSRYEYYSERIKKIREKIEIGIGYSTEKAIEKCKKRNKNKQDDIGEDALVMALKR